MTCGVYKIANKIDGKVYIGSSVEISRRWRVHKNQLRRNEHHSAKLQRAWLKHGEDAFEFSTLLICERAMTIVYEARAIAAYDAVSSGYNCSPDAGPYSLGHACSDDTRAKIGAANRGKHRSEIALARLKTARAGKKPALGMRHTQESKNRMSAARRGKRLSPERAEALRLTRVGTTHSAETRAKISAARRKHSTKLNPDAARKP